MNRPSSNITDLPSNLVGASGVSFVAAELSRRGYVASVTLRNARGIDILATNADASRSVCIQVKTNSEKKKDWILNQEAERMRSVTLFYVFVHLTGLGQLPEYHVVPSEVVADYLTRTHQEWRAKPDREGKTHGESDVRKFQDSANEYRDRWDILGL